MGRTSPSVLFIHLLLLLDASERGRSGKYHEALPERQVLLAVFASDDACYFCSTVNSATAYGHVINNAPRPSTLFVRACRPSCGLSISHQGSKYALSTGLDKDDEHGTATAATDEDVFYL